MKLQFTRLEGTFLCHTCAEVTDKAYDIHIAGMDRIMCEGCVDATLEMIRKVRINNFKYVKIDPTSRSAE